MCVNIILLKEGVTPMEITKDVKRFFFRSRVKAILFSNRLRRHLNNLILTGYWNDIGNDDWEVNCNEITLTVNLKERLIKKVRCSLEYG